MNKKIQILPLLLAGLFMAQPSFVSACTPCEFAQAWRKALTCRARSYSEEGIINGSLTLVGVTVGIALCISAIKSMTQIYRDIRKGIEEHDNDLVQKIAARMMPSALGDYLWNALYNGNHEAMKILLERGAKPDTYLWGHGTPLCVALTRDDFKAAHILLDHGADPLKSNHRGVRPIDYAYKNEELAQKMRNKVEEQERRAADQLDKHYSKKPAEDAAKSLDWQRVLKPIQPNIWKSLEKKEPIRLPEIQLPKMQLPKIELSKIRLSKYLQKDIIHE